MPCRGFMDFSGVLKDDGFHSRSATCWGLLCEWQWHAFTSVDPKIEIPPKRMVKPFFTFSTSLLEMDLLQRFPSGSLIALITLSSDPDSQLCQNDDVWMAVLTRITCTNLGTKNTQAGWPVESSPEASNTESWHSVLRPWAWSSWSARKIGWRRPGWDL